MKSNTNKESEILIRKYIKHVIKENNASDAAAFGGLGGYDSHTGGLANSMSMYRRQTNSGGSLYDTFVKPFVNVLNVAVGKTKEIARRTFTILHVAFEAAISMLVPFVSAEYDKIFESEAADIEQIKSEYSEYYEATNNSLTSGGFGALAMIAFPGAYFAGVAVDKGPKAAKSLLGFATGGTSDKLFRENKNKFKDNQTFSPHNRLTYKILFETDDDSDAKKDAILAQQIKLIAAKALKSSPLAMGAAKQAQDAYKNKIKKSIELATRVLKAKSIEQLEAITKKKLYNIEDVVKIAIEKHKKENKGVEPSEEEEKIIRQDAKDVSKNKTLDTATVSSLKKIFTLPLENAAMEASKDVGKDNPYVLDHLEAVKIINAL